MASHMPGPAAGSNPVPGRLSIYRDRSLLGETGHSETIEHYGRVAARILISAIFLLSGVGKIMNWDETETQMAHQGMILVPFFHVAAILVEVLGGLSLLLGFWSRLGALVLLLYLIPVTLTFHLFWTYPPEQQQLQMVLFLHNLALMGGLLMVITGRNSHRHPR